MRQQAGGVESARRGMASSLLHIGRSEGLAGLQAGLTLAVVREASKAFFRIGCFQARCSSWLPDWRPELYASLSSSR